MNIGKLYQFKKLCWMLFPSKDIADALLFAAARTGGAQVAAADATTAAYYSNKYNCNVSYIEPNSIFVFLEQDGYCCKILTTNGELGWIYLADWLIEDIEEVTV